MIEPTRWTDVDWRRSDAQIGSELGVSRQYVYLKRKNLGARAPVRTTLLEQVAGLPVEELTTTEMARRLGVVRSSVAKACNVLGRTPAAHAPYQRQGTAIDRLEGLDTASMTIPEIARALKCNIAYTYRLVAQHQVPYLRQTTGRPKTA